MLSPKPSVPSTSLLRYLRSQTESPSFFTPSVSCARPPRRAQPPPSSRPVSAAHDAWTPSSTWRDSGAAPCRPSLEASFFPIPRFSPRSRGGASASRCRAAFGQNPSYAAQSLLAPSRASSTKSRPFLRRLLDFRRNKEAANAKLEHGAGAGPLLNDEREGHLNFRRSLAAKASNELRLRCTEFDSNGDVTLVNGEFKKTELIAKYGLLPRDLRKIDSSTLPHILVRPSAILINLLHLRVLIKSDRVLVFDAYGSTDSYMQSLFVYDLEGKLRQKQSQGDGVLPYEFRALEAIMISVTTGLEEEFNGVKEPVVRVLRALEEDIDREQLRHLLIYSKRLGTFEQKARLVRDAIEDLLEADDDLAAMYLSESAHGIQRPEHDHQEVEMLLESYHKVCDEIVQSSGNLVTGIRNTEEVVKAILDANRNSLMLLDLKFSIGTLGLATGTLFSALYGMNLKNFIEESDLGFGAVSVTCFAITGVVCLYGLAKLRKLQRVRMWGESGAGASPLVHLPTRTGTYAGRRSNWRADSIEPVWGSLPGEGRSERLKRLRDGAAAAQRAAATSAARNAAASKRNASSSDVKPAAAASPSQEST
ncbi:inner membrane magnesium transporter MRS2, mitochondrial precursor [Aspergillus campestris IBT 28561]|uniref:Magnesium transporter n=1 Tax=Aspergillus campestris (strain IBT 28561) TaxID=1392248 RepID=A0A2I1D7I4_ASPC2|nr:inner membrane magnesium transporter MRS2, mitochondrial precursor [Aspergillus campestris IBT 28561]PKY05813.1 inner membrane magnesium transporter MRS2, mitochondrial precursor [Aspergillus campestris IBT 28561]